MNDYKEEISFPRFTLAQILNTANLVEKMTEGERKQIYLWCRSGYDADKHSREGWEAMMAEANEFALQVSKQKTTPWEGASNVRFPLVSIAVLHYHARVFPLMTSSDQPVLPIVYGPDLDGSRNERAMRVSRHLSWQFRSQVKEWMSEHDKMLFMQGITGLGIKKTWWDAGLRRMRSMAVSPNNLVFNYWSRGRIDDYTRATYLYEMTSNEIRTMVAMKLFCEAYSENGEGYEGNDGDNDADDIPPLAPVRDPVRESADLRTGMQEPQIDAATPFQMYEQICWMDLDGDEYMEPYFVTFDDSGVLRRVVARFDEGDITRNADKVIVSIRPERCYDAYPLIPSPDGSAMPVGFAILLGPINDACSTAFNQLFDAGTLANYGGGFLGRGARLRGGKMRVVPGEWAQVDSVGGDLKNNIVPFPNPQPSQVLFALVQYLVQYAERLVSANELQTGEDIGQNTPAQTAQTMDQNGSRIVSAIFKRDWDAYGEEIQTFLCLNRKYLKADADYLDITSGKSALVTPQDYALLDCEIVPSADPTIISETQLENRDRAVMGMAFQMPNFNRYESVRRLLTSMKVPAIDRVFPPLPQGQTDLQTGPTPQQLKAQSDTTKANAAMLVAQARMLAAKAKAQEQVAKLQADLADIQADIMNKQSQAVLFLAQAKGANEGKEIALINAAIGARKHQIDGLMGIIGHLMEVGNMSMDAAQGASNGPSADEATNAGAPAAPVGNGSQGLAGPSGQQGIFDSLAAGTGIGNGGMGGGGVH